MKFTQVFAAKNLTTACWLLLQLLVMSAIGIAFRMPIGPKQMAEAVVFTAVTALLLWSAGNFASVRNPRPADPDSSMRARASGGLQALLLFVYPLTFLPSALAYFARWVLGAEWAFYGVMAVMIALAGMVYWVALESAADYADREREAIVTALSQRQGPIAS
jgi:hypothetical protein